MPLPLDAQSWPDPLDPGEVKDYEVDFSDVLVSGETITDKTISIADEPNAPGLAVDSPAATLINGDTAVKLWASVASASQSDGAYAGPGIEAGVTVNITTSDSRTYEKTCGLTIRQR